MPPLRLAPLVLALAIVASACAPEDQRRGSPVVLRDPGAVARVTLAAHAVADDGGRLSIEEVSTRTVELRPMSEMARHRTPGRGITWLRYELVNETSIRDWSFELTVRQLVLDAWTLDGSAVRHHSRHGLRVPVREIGEPGRLARLPVTVEPGGTATVWLRVEHDVAGWEIDLASSRRLAERERLQNLGIGVYFGVAAGLLLYNLFLFFALRDASHLFYVLFHTGIAAFVAGSSGVIPGYFRSGDAPPYSGGASHLLAALFAILFARSYLRLRDQMPRMDRTLLVVSWLALAGAVAGIAGAPVVARAVGPVVSLSTAVLLVGAAVIRWRQGFGPAVYFLPAWVALVTTTVLFNLRTYGVLPFAYAFHWPGVMATSTVDLVLLALGLAARMRRVTDEAGAARLEAERERVRARDAVVAGMLAAEERERARIAADLHDGLGQQLLALKTAADHGAASADGESRRILTQIAGIARDCIGDTRRIARNLHPHALEQLGLARALESLAEQVGTGAGISVETNIDQEAAAAVGEGAIHVFRIAQEAISNAVRHGGARWIDVQLAREDDGVALTVTDDGRGFAVDDQNSGLGLATVEERAKLLDGVLAVRSTPGEGAEISVRFAPRA